MTILRINWRNDIRMIEIKVLQAHQGDCIWVRCISEKTDILMNYRASEVF